jgi:broad specificity phosphatase PhoE
MGEGIPKTIENREKPYLGPTIYLMRHGKTKYSEDGSDHEVFIDADDPITDLGREQSAAAAEQIASEMRPGEKVVIIASPFQRAQESAAVMAATFEKKGVVIARRGLARRLAERFDKWVWNNKKQPQFKTGQDRDDFARRRIHEDHRLGKTKLFTWKNILPFVYGDAQPLIFKDAEGDEHVARMDTSLSNPEGLNHKEFFARNGIGKLLQNGTLRKILKGQHPPWSKSAMREFEDTVRRYETFAETTMRMIHFLSDVRAEYAKKKVRIVVVTHRALLNFIAEYFTDGEHQSVEPGEYIKLENQGTNTRDDSLVVTQVGSSVVTKGEDVFKATRDSLGHVKKGRSPLAHRASPKA